MEEQRNLPWLLNSFQQFEKSLNGSRGISLHALRNSALKDFQQLGIPSPKQEAWKYTNVHSSFSTESKLAMPETVSEDQLLPYFGANQSKHCAVFVNGYFSKELSNLGKLPKGVTFKELSECLAEGSEFSKRVESHLGKYASTNEESLVALNTAFVREGIVLLLEKSVEVDEPFQIVFVTAGENEAEASYPRLLIIAEDQSKASIVETYIGLKDKSYLTNSVTEFFVGSEANVSHYRIQIENEAATHISHTQILQEEKSSFKTFNISFGGKLVRNQVYPELQGEHAFCGMYGLTAIGKEQHVDNYTSLYHAVPNCESDEQYKGVYSGKSKGIFSGTITVEKDAQKTNAIQSNQSILLSRDAEINTRPQLKIWADDVKCTHGATIGELDELALFYLRSRGIPKEHAKRMLIDAFAAEVTEKIEIDFVKSWVEELFVSKVQIFNKLNHKKIVSDYPKALQELVDEIKASSDPAYVSDLLVEYGESFKEVPEQIATRPFNKDHLVPGCESEAYIWATSVEGMPQFYFAVENPQGISAKAMAAIIDETFSDLSTEEISKISEEVVYDIFGKELSMGKALGLMNMIRMIKSLAKDL